MCLVSAWDESLWHEEDFFLIQGKYLEIAMLLVLPDYGKFIDKW